MVRTSPIKTNAASIIVISSSTIVPRNLPIKFYCFQMHVLFFKTVICRSFGKIYSYKIGLMDQKKVSLAIFRGYVRVKLRPTNIQSCHIFVLFLSLFSVFLYLSMGRTSNIKRLLGLTIQCISMLIFSGFLTFYYIPSINLNHSLFIIHGHIVVKK